MNKFMIFLIYICCTEEVTTNVLEDYFQTKIYELQGIVKFVQEKLVNFFSPQLKEDVIRKSNQEESGPKVIFTESKETKKSKEKPHRFQILSQKSDFLSGHNLESHKIRTEDGYFLTLHRMIASKKMNKSTNCNKTVLLHHGLLGSSNDWLLLPKIKSLPYILQALGYDVWMSNARGNYYSRKHDTLPIKSTKFWNFTWQDIGQFDIPATIDYIQEYKNESSINYIGHSLGATALLVLLSTQQKYNEKIRIAILLAPIALSSNMQGPIVTMFRNSENSELLKDLNNMISKSGEFLPSRKVPKSVVQAYCNEPILFCSNPLFYLTGTKLERNYSIRYIAKILKNVPSGGSTNTILHYAQLAQTKKFSKYRKEKEEFLLKFVSVPTILISSSDDWLAPVPDVEKLYGSISNPVHHLIIRNQNITHPEFVWGVLAKDLVFSKVTTLLKDDISFNNTEINVIESKS